ncbi:MAG TPA: hypothetical protein VFU69_11525 [Ktedonobacterales bacterium]|nr:hypothetical protein [Ktedonobacterales bacterium]
MPHQMTSAEVAAALRKYAPPVLDPFAGGASIPLEAQRLGLEAHASDLNPVAVLINKSLIEIPPKFANCPPIHPVESQALLQREWRGAQGLAEDVRYYGKCMRAEAEKRIGHLYPKVTLPKEQGGGEATVIAWIWTRIVKCPNPACGVQMPLVRSLLLSTKKGKEVQIEPVVDEASKKIRFEVRIGKASSVAAPKIGRGATFRCLACGQPANEINIRQEFQAKRAGQQLIAIVAQTQSGRVYLPATDEHAIAASSAKPNWLPDEEMNQDTSDLVSGRGYGITHWFEIFTPRQLVALTTFSDLVTEVRTQIQKDAIVAGLASVDTHINGGGSDVATYATALATYLAFIVDKTAEYNCTLVPWYSKEDRPKGVFARQAIPMVWDFAEVNPLGSIGGTFIASMNIIADAVENTPTSTIPGHVLQKDAMTPLPRDVDWILSTDPPYYNNIGYADLSDFFYIWLRRSLGKLYPDLFSTLLVPKTQELVASPHRFGGNKSKADDFFEDGLGKAFTQMRQAQQPGYPLTVYYAFKQAEYEDDDKGQKDDSQLSASTGWETMLEGLLKAGFSITGTWPIRTERSARSVGLGTNALASSIVLVCRPRAVDAPLTSRGEFLRSLKRELPAALKDLQRGHIAPVDLAQAAIGPGMAVFSRYSKVLEADGSPMRVRTALQLINQALDEVLAEQEGEYDAETRWAVAWFEQFGLEEADYGVAETLSKAKNTAVERLVEAGILSARGGKVRLLRRAELSDGWNPAKQPHLTAWDVTQRLIKSLLDVHGGGEQGAAAILDQVGGLGEIARDLAYRLYTTCERKGWAQEALAYNSLVVDWREIAGEAARLPVAEQAKLL